MMRELNGQVKEMLRNVRNDVRQSAYEKDELLEFFDKVEELVSSTEKTFGDVRIGTHLVAKRTITLYEGTKLPEGEIFEVVDIQYNPVKDAYTAMTTPVNKDTLSLINKIDGITGRLAVYLNKQYNVDFSVVEEQEPDLEDY